ncbi:MAG: hypothetical protein OHK0011_00930 [Turneriella sp.]
MLEETTPEQLEELRYRFYEKQMRAGHKIRLEQVHICRHCGQAYKLNPSAGSSRTHCEAQDCRDEAKRAAVMRDNRMRQELYRRNQRNDRQRQAALRARKAAAQVMGFQYV